MLCLKHTPMQLTMWSKKKKKKPTGIHQKGSEELKQQQRKQQGMLAHWWPQKTKAVQSVMRNGWVPSPYLFRIERAQHHSLYHVHSATSSFKTRLCGIFSMTRSFPGTGNMEIHVMQLTDKGIPEIIVKFEVDRTTNTQGGSRERGTNTCLKWNTHVPILCGIYPMQGLIDTTGLLK